MITKILLGYQANAESLWNRFYDFVEIEPDENLSSFSPRKKIMLFRQCVCTLLAFATDLFFMFTFVLQQIVVLKPYYFIINISYKAALTVAITSHRRILIFNQKCRKISQRSQSNLCNQSQRASSIISDRFISYCANSGRI